MEEILKLLGLCISSLLGIVRDAAKLMEFRLIKIL